MTDTAEEIDDQLALLDEVIKAARKAGADAADALIYQSASLEASFRLGAREDLERSESKRLGLRAFIGQRQAAVSSNDVSNNAQAEMIERVVAMARAAPEDPYCGLAESGQIPSARLAGRRRDPRTKRSNPRREAPTCRRLSGRRALLCP